MTDSRATPKPPDGTNYADVRGRLVAMGYLARPLDRYVLGGIARPGSFLLRHAAVSLRVAIAAGPLLGLLFALAVVVANRPRFSHARDFLVLAGAFTLVFGVAVFALELAAGALLGALVRWRGRGVAAFPATAARAGFAVSLVLSAYLAYWWRRRSGTDAGLALDLAGLAILVLVNAVLLRVSSLASLAALVRVSDLPEVARERSAGDAASSRRESTGDAPAIRSTVERARRSRLLAPALLAAVLLIAGFFIAPRSRATDASPFTRTPVGKGRMVVVAWDGVDPRALERVVSHGGPAGVGERAPEESEDGMTRGIMSSWRRMTIRRPPEALLGSPAQLWTAVATGRVDNGVGSLEETRPVGLSGPMPGTAPLADLLRVMLPGRRIAVSARVRTAKTLWEIMGNEEGIACIGWWATWPAQERPTHARAFAIVSDRALLALERPSAGRFLIAPSSLERRLNAEFESDLGAVRNDLASPSFRRLAEWLAAQPDRVAAHRVEQSFLIDGYALRLAPKLLEDATVKDLFVYLPGLDIARSAAGGSQEGSLALFLYGNWVRERIEDLDRTLEPEDRMVVLAFPGRAASVPDVEGRWATLLMREPQDPAGPVLRPAAGGMDLLDIAPSLLNLRGFPVSREMEGRSLVQFEDESRRPPPIDTYGRNALPTIPFSSSSEEDERETLERLRSLGYLN